MPKDDGAKSSNSSAEPSVVSVLTRSGRHATVEVLANGAGELTVRKTYLTGKEEFFARECESLKALREICPEVVPPLLHQGKNYLVIPYYPDPRPALARVLGISLPLPLKGLRKAFRAAQTFYDKGFVLGDFRPHNLLFERDGGVKIIDYELVYDRRSAGAPPFDERTYRVHWLRKTGISLHSLMHDPLWLAVTKRWSIGPFVMAGAALAKSIRHQATRSQHKNTQPTASE